MAVATGFFNKATEIMDDRRRFMAEHRAKTNDYLMTYGTQAVTAAEEGAQGALATASILENEFNIDPENISYIIDTSGVAGLDALMNRIKDIEPNVIKATDFNEFFKKTVDYTPSGVSLVDSINKSFGLYKSAAGSDPVENRQTGMLSAFGIDLFGRESEEFRTAGGYSEADVRRIGATPKQNLKTAVPFDFSQLPVSLSERQTVVYEEVALSRIEEVARQYQASLPSEDGLRTTIESAINNGEYLALSKIPELKKGISLALQKLEKGIPGSVSSNGLLYEYQPLLEEQEPISQEEYFNMRKSRSSEKSWADKGLTTYSDLESAGFVFDTGAEAMEAIESGMIPEGQYYLIGNKLGFNESDKETGSVVGGSVGGDEDVDIDQVYEGLDDNDKSILEAEAYILMTRHPEMRPAVLMKRLEKYKEKNFKISTEQNMSPANDAEIAELIEAERNRLKNQFTEITEATLDRKLKAFEDRLKSR